MLFSRGSDIQDCCWKEMKSLSSDSEDGVGEKYRERDHLKSDVEKKTANEQPTLRSRSIFLAPNSRYPQAVKPFMCTAHEGTVLTINAMNPAMKPAASINPTVQTKILRLTMIQPRSTYFFFFCSPGPSNQLCSVLTVSSNGPPHGSLPYIFVSETELQLNSIQLEDDEGSKTRTESFES
ncbi:hypothetical protein LXL04_032937 [Taraxacum kok-saghyz]